MKQNIDIYTDDKLADYDTLQPFQKRGYFRAFVRDCFEAREVIEQKSSEIARLNKVIEDMQKGNGYE